MRFKRVLIAHNAYQLRGGEDAVVEREAELLERSGHVVALHQRTNHEIHALSKCTVARDTIWSRRTASEFGTLMQKFRADIVHVHNTFPLISPSIYWPPSRTGTPVVQTLHNFRLACPQGLLMRSGGVCEACVGKLPWRSLVHRCYRGSFIQSALATTMLGVHRALRTYQDRIARYIVMNEFCRRKFIQAGLPAQRLSVKPNFVDVPAPDPGGAREGGLFVGRFADEKGIDLILEVARARPEKPLRMVGDGPRLKDLQGHPGVVLLGWKDQEAVWKLMRTAAYVVMPSIWYETFGLVIAEAFGNATPVIASRMGAMQEAVSHGRTGLLFEPGDARDLAAKMEWADSHPDAMREMGREARRDYEARYTSGANYEQLLAIYAEAELHVRAQEAPVFDATLDEEEAGAQQ